jgi:hypothetical protein
MVGGRLQQACPATPAGTGGMRDMAGMRWRSWFPQLRAVISVRRQGSVVTTRTVRLAGSSMADPTHVVLTHRLRWSAPHPRHGADHRVPRRSSPRPGSQGQGWQRGTA